VPDRWGRFRSLPTAVQVVLWLAALPLVVLLAMTRGSSHPRWRLAAGTAALAVAIPVAAAVWVALYLTPFAGSPEEPADPAAEAGSPTPAAEAATEGSAPDPGVTNEAGERAAGPATTTPGSPSRLTPAQPTAPVPGSLPPDLPPARAPPQDVDTGAAGSGVLVAALLAELPVAAEQSAGYDRSLFPHWTTTGGCSTRSHVLIRDSGGTATVEANCRVTSGSWYSPFDDVWVTSPGDLDIDHLVPLAEAWRSGARDWDTDTRRRFANDLTDPRTLIAVTSSANRSKGDRDPARWLPPHQEHRCDYVGSWVAVKHTWGLSVDVAEREAIVAKLASCGELRTSPTAPARPTTGPPPPQPEPSQPEPSQPEPSQPEPFQPEPSQPGPETCVNINTASADELTRIVHIGPARAQDLAAKRPFVTVDDLVRIDGIGPARLADIKAQALACVS
jgi:predicted flap endonuclease-1-like 5' DNA nuclease